MRLVACQVCHAQYDVTGVVAKAFPCRCGASIENKLQQGVDTTNHRCGSCGGKVRASAESCEWCGCEIVRDTWNLSLICPECYARNAEQTRYCTSCGVAFRPEPMAEYRYELPCPVCSSLMPGRTVGGVGINECGQCNGVWVPEENFDHLVSRAIDAKRDQDPQRALDWKPRVKGGNPAAQRVQYRKCPVCEKHMRRKNYRKTSGVIIDLCKEHGTWLDADELEQIAGFILSGGRPAADQFMEQYERESERKASTPFLTHNVDIEFGQTRTNSAGRGLLSLLSDLLN